MKKAVILDISAMIYRAHFALMNMKNSEGVSTGATYGFVNTIEGIIKELNPDYMVACLDVKRSELKRSEELATYKTHRESMPNELVEQLEYIMEVLDGYGVPKYKVLGYEADDVMATFAKKFAEDGEEDIEVFVITGDKDLAQIVNEKVNIALLGKGDGKSLFKYLKTDEDVVEHLGVTPEKIPDLFGLMGDASDGIPGVPGVGPKTGIKYINEYGDLEGLYANIDKIKGKIREKLIDNEKNAFLSRKLATVDRGVDVEYDKTVLARSEKDFEKLLKIYRKLEFKKFSEEIAKNVELNRLADEKNKIKYLPLNSLDDIENQEISMFQNEFGLAISNGHDIYVSLEKEGFDYGKLKDKEIIAYNIKEFVKKGLECEAYFDVMLAWYVLGTESSQDLENIIFSEFEVSLETFENQFKKRNMDEITEGEKKEFLGKRAYYIYKLKEVLRNKLVDDKLDGLYYDLENKLVPVLADMEKNGIQIDKDYFEEYKIQLKKNVDNLETEIYHIVGYEFNIGSTKQLAKVLFEDIGIEPVKKTKTGYSTDMEVLELLADREIEIAKKLLDYRAYAKLLSTYVEPILKLADENSRIHTTFNQNGTATGRLSSVNPNLQNIPTKTDEGTKIRKGFISKEGWSLVSFDYSQIELRVLAELCEDENLLLAYKKDADLHDLTARKIFYKMPEEEVTKFERSVAKVINFSILYGKTPFGLSKELKIPLQDASLYIKTYFKQYPRVKEFVDSVLEEARRQGFVETMYGTRRYLRGINSSNKNIRAQAERMAVNTIIQGSAANVIKKVMLELYNNFKDKEGIKILLQVHDELIFEIADEKIEEYMVEIKEIMENTVKFKNLRLKANGSYSKNWGDLK